MKLALVQAVPAKYDQAMIAALFGRIERQVNLLAEGRLTGRHFTASSKPTTGDFAQGDVIWNSAPAEAGSGGSKYVIAGWICTVAGSPGTLLDMRWLTGN